VVISYPHTRHDEVFRESLLEEGVELFLSGNVGTGRAVLRDYINTTIGFEELAVLTDISSKSLMRMFGLISNPRASNLFKIIAHLQSREDVHLKVHADKRAILDNQSEDIG